MLLLIDQTRRFTDDRECILARTPDAALRALIKHGDKIKIIWIDNEFGPGPKGSIKPVLDFLAVKAKLGQKSVNVINVHAPTEAGWQIIQAKLAPVGYLVRRETIRGQLGAY